MNIHLTLDSLMAYIGFTMGILLGVGLVLNSRKNKASFFLGLFIICYSLGVAPNILSDFSFNYPFFAKVSHAVNFNWLLFPLFYLYVQHISILKEKDILWPIEIASIGVLIEFVFLLLFDLNETSELIFNFVNLMEISFSIWIGIKIVFWIKKQKKEVFSQYSNVNSRDLKWSRNFVIIGLLFTALSTVSFFNEDNIYFIFFLINILLLFWVSLKGVFQKEISSLTVKPVKIYSEPNPKELRNIIENASLYIKESKAYRKTDLTIVDLAKELSLHPKKLSESINKVLLSNFNHYINSFRIEEAKGLLLSKEADKLSIEGIGAEVGFQSKSTFFRVFKSQVGITPSTFKMKRK